MFGSKKPHPETCERCPHRYSERGCPAWVRPELGFTETNDLTGEVRVLTGCFYEVILKVMVHIVRAANRPSVLLQELRTETGQAFSALAQGLAGVIRGTLPVGGEDQKALEHDDGKGD